jgi:hypothetical protein
MKGKFLSAMLITLLIAPFSFAEKNSERIHYKCHLKLSDQREVIHQFVSAGKTQTEFEEGLPGSTVYAADGVTGLAIETVYQCVKAKQKFKGEQAQDLEEKTPF